MILYMSLYNCNLIPIMIYLILVYDIIGNVINNFGVIKNNPFASATILKSGG